MIVPHAELQVSEPLLTPWRISTERYVEMIEDGVFDRIGDRVELVCGMIADMSPANANHDYLIEQLMRFLNNWMSQGSLRVQSTLVLAEGHVYDPDIMLLLPHPDVYKNILPRPENVALVIEVAGTSLAKDRRIKQPEYAKAGIPEFWLVNLNTQTLTVHREPEAETYRRIETLSGEQTIFPTCMPEAVLKLSDLFG